VRGPPSQILAILNGCALLCVMLDTAFSRQPYYASFHAIVGILFCWSWLVFSAVYEVLGGERHPAACRRAPTAYRLSDPSMNVMISLIIPRAFI